ncbi:MAG: hypothetical protein AUH08_11960 [Verrucomicrobia bacterium 13_2_20CM_54_12]|nr:MAG: hypothetical protein AUH08_11960 [Verrucomicrobia bacterium 13_2_20CM_54_12]
MTVGIRLRVLVLTERHIARSHFYALAIHGLNIPSPGNWNDPLWLGIFMPDADPADRQDTNDYTGAFGFKPAQPLRSSRRLYAFQNKIANFTFFLVANALEISPYVPVSKADWRSVFSEGSFS